VLGVLCAAIGSVQVAEAVKLVVGQGEPLVGRLLVHDSLRQTWDSLTVRADPGCAVCGQAPTVTSLVDYDDFCGMPGAAADGRLAAMSVPEVTAPQLASMLEARERGEVRFELVDVREPGEREVVSIPGARAIHLDSFRTGAAAGQLPNGIPVVVHCKSGARSAEAAALLMASGRPDVSNLAGGVLAWVRDVDPSLATY
jgi:adenylyltransferase/sulfurtransferase